MSQAQNQKTEEKGEYIITVPCINLFFYIPHVKIEKEGNECHVYLKSDRRYYQFGARVPPIPIDVRKKLIHVLRQFDEEKLIEYVKNYENVDKSNAKLIKTTIVLDTYDTKKLLKLVILTQVKVSKLIRILISYDKEDDKPRPL